MPNPQSTHDGYLLVYNGECGFCRYTVEYARAVTDGEAAGRVRYQPYQDAAPAHPEVSLDEFERSIQLFTPSGRYAGAEAAFRVLALAPRLAGWWWCYRYLPGFARFTELLYGLTSRHRVAAMRLARPLFGARLLPADYRRTASWLSRGIALAAACAFASWWWQAAGLVGADGILPVERYFAAAAQQLGPLGWLQLPSLYWLSSADWMTTALCAAGILASLALLLRLWPALAALMAFASYLSLEYGGQVFMQFQWDALLVESLFLAFILNAWPRAGIWATRLLLFRFMLLSGAVKLLSGDPTWQALTALDYHFETQPLPTALAWYAHHLPGAWLQAGVVGTYVIELLLPCFIFMPRNLRLVAAAGFILLQLLILATGNYNFFNLLVLVLCLAMLDDRALGYKPGKLQTGRSGTAGRAILLGLALLGALQIHATFDRSGLYNWERSVLAAVQPWQLVNSYGLFAVMTTQRNELVVEGSYDGQTWTALPFRFKPQALDEQPRWVTPYQPRLDWQMWFAALTSPQGAPWFSPFLARLLQGSAPVYALLAQTPFATDPPRFVRVAAYRYQFTSARERRATGNWWRRDYLGDWFPTVALPQTTSRSDMHTTLALRPIPD